MVDCLGEVLDRPALIEQVEGLVDVLKDKGVKVYRSTRLTEEEFQYLGNLRRGNGQLYPRERIVKNLDC